MNILRLLGPAKKAATKSFPLIRDARVPLWLKIATGAGAVLIISPLDLFGDIPVLGAIDDAVLLTLLATVFVAVAERYTITNVTPVTATELATE